MIEPVNNQHVVVLGAARSGVAGACLLKRKGASVFVSDHGSIAPDMKRRLTEAQIDFEEGGHTDQARGGEYAVVSPGVPTSAPIVRHYLDNGRAVYSELEMASWFNQSPIVGVTGSNGKTTVTYWLQDIWSRSDQSSIMAGNVGYAFSDYVEQTQPDKYAILEVSSFQLDHIHSFRPNIGVLLNLTPDHLDRYDNSFEKYCQAKFRLLENQTENDWIIYNYDDSTIREYVHTLTNQKGAPGALPFSSTRELDRGIFIRDQQIIFNIHGKEEPLMSKDDIGLQGNHNLKNGLASALAARAAEIHNEAIRESLKQFEGVEHRLETVRTHKGVQYINDSKATNVNALWYALDSFSQPIILIMGGRDKGNDYSEVFELVRQNVRAIIAIGESADKVERELSDKVEQFTKSTTMDGAVRQASKWARENEIVLLSPACASFDMFEDYEHRGRVFKESVNKL